MNTLMCINTTDDLTAWGLPAGWLNESKATRRLAAFDADGTLWADDTGIAFFEEALRGLWLLPELLGKHPFGPGKPLALVNAAGAWPDVAFGNSSWDLHLLASAHAAACAINPDETIAAAAASRGWTVRYL